jgi:hypothetical protein
MDIEPGSDKFYGPAEISILTKKIKNGEERSILLLLSLRDMQDLRGGGQFNCFYNATHHAIQQLLKEVRAKGIELPSKINCVSDANNCGGNRYEMDCLLLIKQEENHFSDRLRGQKHDLFLSLNGYNEFTIQAMRPCGNHFHYVGWGDYLYYRAWPILEALRKLLNQ